MAKSSRQTFKKRQKEMAKKQKKEDKARRLAARRNGGQADDIEEKQKVIEYSKDEKPTLKIFVSGGSHTSEKK